MSKNAKDLSKEYVLAVSTIKRSDLVYRSIYHAHPTDRKWNSAREYYCYVCNRRLFMPGRGRIDKKYVFYLTDELWGLGHIECQEIYKITPNLYDK